jgi:ABC-2 type transport system permease protein
MPYVAIASARFRTLLQYRAAAIAGVWTQTFFGLTMLMIYEAFYQQGAATPISFPQLASYVWLGQGLLAMVPWNVDGDIRAMVRTGAVATELCRPIDLYNLWFARAVAWRTAPTMLRALPMAVLAMVVLPAVGLGAWRLQPPSLAGGCAFGLALLGAVAVSCAISTLLHISLLWTLSGDGLVTISASAVSLLSGLIVPLPLMPSWARATLEWLPFAGVVDAPFRLYAGSLPPSQLGLVLARQLGWTLILVGAGRWLMKRGLARLVVQGG